MIERERPDAAGWRRLDEVLATLRPVMRLTRRAPPHHAPARRPPEPSVVPRHAPIG